MTIDLKLPSARPQPTREPRAATADGAVASVGTGVGVGVDVAVLQPQHDGRLRRQPTLSAGLAPALSLLPAPLPALSLKPALALDRGSRRLRLYEG